jgi:curli biogenesis system outer membrane secretion channel CsgG
MVRAGVWAVMALLTGTGFLGCGPSAQVVNPGGPTIREAMSEPSTGKKMRIAVMRFENRSRYDVGTGMRAMMTSALFRTNKFIVVEREMLTDVLLEQQLGATGAVSSRTAAPVGEVEGAQLLIYGTITAFEPGQRGISTIVGGAQQSYVAMDLRIVDSRTSRVLSTTTVEGRATDVNLSTAALKYVGMSPLYYLEVWNNTPMGSAIRLCIDQAVGYIIQRIE